MAAEETARAEEGTTQQAQHDARPAPTALTGLADWGTAARKTQRVGVVHAAANSVALTLYVTSLFQRRRGRRRAGVVLSLLGSAFLGTGGLLGGHLMVMQGLGPDATDDLS